MRNHNLSAALRTAAALLEQYPEGLDVCTARASDIETGTPRVAVQFAHTTEGLTRLARWARLLGASVVLTSRPLFVKAAITVEVATHDDPWSVTRVEFWDHLAAEEIPVVGAAFGLLPGSGGEFRTVTPEELLAVAGTDTGRRIA